MGDHMVTDASAKKMAFSLEKFESLAYGRNREMGVRELLALLQDLDANYGQVGAQFKAQPLQSVAQKTWICMS